MEFMRARSPQIISSVMVDWMSYMQMLLMSSWSTWWRGEKNYWISSRELKTQSLCLRGLVLHCVLEDGHRFVLF